MIDLLCAREAESKPSGTNTYHIAAFKEIAETFLENRLRERML